MNKAELIDVLTDKMGSDRRQATAAVENVVDTIVRAVHKGDSVTITGFGVFEQRRRAARVARNPRTGGRWKFGSSLRAGVSARHWIPKRCFWRTKAPGGRTSSETWRNGEYRRPEGSRKAAVKKAVKRTAVKKAVKQAAVKKAVKPTAVEEAVKQAAVKKAVKQAPRGRRQ